MEDTLVAKPIATAATAAAAGSTSRPHIKFSEEYSCLQLPGADESYNGRLTATKDKTVLWL